MIVFYGNHEIFAHYDKGPGMHANVTEVLNLVFTGTTKESPVAPFRSRYAEGGVV